MSDAQANTRFARRDETRLPALAVEIGRKAATTPTIDKLEKLMQRDANKAHAFWSQMRTDLRLIGRSKWSHVKRLEDQLRGELNHLLESGIFSYPHTLISLGITPETSLQEKKLLLGVEDLISSNPSPKDKELEEFMKQGSYQRRQQEWKWRIANAAEEFNDLGWYPFFVTLTVNPNLYDAKQIWTENKPFRKYIRSLVNVVCKCVGDKPAHKNNTPESHYLQYVGMVEHGKSRMHHHAHFLIWMREIPEAWKKCPNRNIADPRRRNQRECKHMRRYWKYSLPGLSPAIYFRSVGDVWQRIGHCLPVDKKGNPINIGTSRQSGGYVTKYMAKDFKEWNHRIKATRNLGMTRLKAHLNSLNSHQVEALTWRPTIYGTYHSMTMIHTCPVGLLRREAKHRLWFVHYHQKCMDSKNCLKRDYGTWQRLRQSVRNGARPDRMHLQEFYDWASEHLPVITGYCEKRLRQVHETLRGIFPRVIQENRVSIAGEDFGYT
jgi:hypothetical protein